MPTPEVIVDFEPDWNSPPEVSYAFQSVVQSTPRFVEQRRPLLPSPIRGMKCTYTLEAEEAQRLANVLSHGASKFLGVPVYSEPLIPTSLDQGASIISVTEDVSYMWNIQNCLYAIVIDFVSHASEILQVLSASSTTILLSGSILGAYTPANCVVYPAFVGVVKAFDKQPVTDLLFSMTAEFEETSSEHAEASGTWSGLEERVCPEDLIAGSTSPSSSASPSPYVCPDFDPITIVGAGWTERDLDGYIAAAGSDVTINATGPPTTYAYLQKYGLSWVAPWFRFKLEVRSLPDGGIGTVAGMWFYSAGEYTVGISFRSSDSYMGEYVGKYMVIAAEGPFHNFGSPLYIWSSNFDRWIQVRMDPGWLYVDVYTDSGFSNLETTLRSANTGWTDPLTVTGFAPVWLDGYSNIEGLLMSFRNISLCEE